MSQHGKTTLNSQPFAEGIWTYQSYDGRRFSALDFMICDKNDLSLVKGFAVDDSRDYTQINNDHNLIISLIEANCNMVEWPKSKPRMKWDLTYMNKTKYKSTLKESLVTAQEKGEAKGEEYNNCAVSRLNDISTAINEALTASSKLISSSPKHPKIPPKVVEIQTKINVNEKQRSMILKGCSRPLPKDKENLISELTETIKQLRQEKIQVFMEVNNKLNKRIRKTLKSKGKNSRAFWKLAKPMEVEVSLNRVKKKDDTLTNSPEEALETVREYFQDLFTPRPRPPNKEPIKMPNIGGTSPLSNLLQ